jgi:CDP-diacylglycerol--serine O-phosphatidyltransferase
MALPGAFTTGNLFFGFYAVISACRLELVNASYFVIAGALLDFIDGKVARLSKSYSRFGTEFDSLADVVTFGVAPSVIMFSYFLSVRGEWSWLLVFVFLLAGALRLARFNALDPGPEKKSFTGLPIPVAGCFLVSFIPFSTTPFYLQYLSSLNHEKYLSVVIVITSILMISNVPYPNFPALKRGEYLWKLVIIFFILFLIGIFTIPEYLFFFLGFIYIIYGCIKAVVAGLWERSIDKGNQ